MDFYRTKTEAKARNHTKQTAGDENVVNALLINIFQKAL